jgi:UMF1 family MFS transporter
VAAVLFALFAVPIFLLVKETGPIGRVSMADVAGSLAQLRTSVAHAREVPGLLRFLVGRFFYSDAVNTIIVVMSVVTTRAKGMTDTQALLVLLLLTVVAVFASFGWGRLVDRLGPRRTLMIVLTSWAVGLVLGAISLSVDGPVGLVMFLVAGAILGSGLGGVQVADRVLMVRLSPPERIGEFFGLYGLVGKGSQVIGQLLYGLTLLLFFDTFGVGAYQLAVLTLLGTMLLGAWILRPVDDRWSGSGEVDVHAPPERLAPMTAPMEPR